MQTKKFIHYLALIFLICFPVWWGLTSLPIQMWDEARIAMNAYEMAKNGNWIVTHFEGLPDMWNTKPPLLVWLQVIGIKIFGFGELAIRFPSALATFLTFVFLFTFLMKYQKDFWFACIAVLVLVTSPGYISVHASKTGDYDSLLTLFTTVYCFAFFAYVHTSRIRFLYTTVAFVILSVLTKGIAGVMLLPALAIYAILKKQAVPLLKNKHFYIAALLFVLIVLGYYLLREHFNPGYWEAVRSNELGGRFLSVNEGNEGGVLFYFNYFLLERLPFWLPFVPLGTVIGFLSKDTRIKQLTLYLLLLLTFFFFVISLSKTKLPWYDLPMYPFLAVIVANGIYTLLKWLEAWAVRSATPVAKLLPLIFLFVLFLYPYGKTAKRTIYPTKSSSLVMDEKDINYFLKKEIDRKENLDQHYVLYDGYTTHILVYMAQLRDNGIDLKFKDWQALENNDRVIFNQQNIKDYISRHYTYEVVRTSGPASVVRILNDTPNRTEKRKFLQPVLDNPM